MNTKTFALVLAAGTASAAIAQIEPILYSDGPIPGVQTAGGDQATIWQTGLYRVRNSPDRSRWAIRVNQTSASDNEYIVSGQGLTGSVVVNTSGEAGTVPASSVDVFYISERGLGINDDGLIALSGSTTARATTDAIWLIEPGVGATLIAEEENPAFQRPGGFGDFEVISGPTISNTGKIAFSETDGGSAREEQAILWDPTDGFSELFGEFDDLDNVPGRFVQNIGTGEANALRGAVFFFENDGEDPVVGVYGDLDGSTDDDNFFATRDGATGDFSSIYREGDTIAGQDIITQAGWVDPQGNTYAVPAGGFPPLATVFAVINDEVVLREGGLVGGTIDGETWESQDVGFLISPVVAVDQNAQGGYIVGGTTSNTETFEAGGSSGTTIVTKNQVIIYVAPDGTRTELVRVGDTVTVDVGGTPDERRIVTLNQSDAQFASYLDDTHLYFVAGTDDFAGTIPNDLFARIALPGGCRADLDGDGELTLFDFLAFQNLFDSGDLTADFDGDGSLTLFDFLAFQNEFDAGCP
ncbi:MAG: hypothetical protein HRU13_12045 [Phycisphaerales bacterium]|nr:hypothetical protein [Phycisphaerales bacterium]